jgi:PP-loop superfamily ATP-utilizing enzyme
MIQVSLNSAEQGVTENDVKNRIKKLDMLISKVQKRIGLRHKEWSAEIENMPEKEKKLMKKGMEIFKLDSQRYDA